jgi:hypothetical protein
MDSEIYDPSLPSGVTVVIRRIVVVAVCVALFAIFGVAAPYKIYKHLMAKQDAARVVVVNEEF